MHRRKRTEVLKMSQIKEILRHYFVGGLSQTKISQSVGVSRATVQNYIRRASVAEISKEKLESISESDLLNLMRAGWHTRRKNSELDFHYIQLELNKPGVTLALLWEEYIRSNPEGHGYSGFCHYYRIWKRSKKLSMRQEHKAGEKVYVDFSGQRMPIYDKVSGGIKFQAEIFVAVLGASNYTYAEAVLDQKLSNWLGAHARAFKYFGGVPSVVVPDNLRSGVKKASFYDPEINPGYRDFSEHYNVVVIPTRVRKPKDKSKVEVGVQIVQRWILARLRDKRFYSIADLNLSILKLLENLNNRQMKSYGKSRKEIFDLIEKNELKALPLKEYQIYNTKLCKVNIDYHVEVDKHYYSVPYQYVGKEVEVRIREKSIEVIFETKRIAAHKYSKDLYKHTTVIEHMPKSHQKMTGWSPTRFISWGESIGVETKTQVESLLNTKQHPEQSYRACLGLLRLSKSVGHERLEAACKRANHLGIVSMRRVKSILDSSMEKLPLFENNSKEIEKILHLNIRGRNYYH